MKLSKAIKISRSYIVTRNATLDPEVKEAIKLGIEALKAIQRVRPTEYDDIDLPLPGETED